MMLFTILSDQASQQKGKTSLFRILKLYKGTRFVRMLRATRAVRTVRILESSAKLRTLVNAIAATILILVRKNPARGGAANRPCMAWYMYAVPCLSGCGAPDVCERTAEVCEAWSRLRLVRDGGGNDLRQRRRDPVHARPVAAAGLAQDL